MYLLPHLFIASMVLSGLTDANAGKILNEWLWHGNMPPAGKMIEFTPASLDLESEGWNAMQPDFGWTLARSA